MRIAIVHNLPPGGQKRALYEQVKRLSKKHHLDLFTLSSTDESTFSLKPYIRRHFKVQYYYPPHFPKSVKSIYKDLPKAYQKLANKINLGKYNIAYVCACYLTQAPYVLRYLKIPSVYFCQEPKREFYEKVPHHSNLLTYKLTYPFRLPIKYIDQKNAKKSTQVLVNSQYSKLRVDEIYRVSSTVNYLGVDTNWFKPRVNAAENFILSVGDISILKGHDFVIRSLANITKNIRPKLLIVGFGGTESNYLRTLAHRMEVELTILQKVSESELLRLYNKAKLFTFAAIKEPFGMVLLEAASSGLPIVAVNEGGVKEIVSDDLIGVLTDRNEHEFSYQIIKYLNMRQNNKDKKARHEFVQKNWSWEKSVDELEEHLEQVVDEANA